MLPQFCRLMARLRYRSGTLATCGIVSPWSPNWYLDRWPGCVIPVPTCEPVPPGFGPGKQAFGLDKGRRDAAVIALAELLNDG